MIKRMMVCAAALALFAGGTARADDLGVGDKAPAIKIAKWVKGKEVDLAKAGPDEVFVVEFWATWCGPCKMSIPHMSEMQDHFKDKKVTFIGVSDEEPKVVEKFLKDGFDSKMRYTVAIDEDNKTDKAWMKAAGQDGIPTAFVVKGGKILWIGHPMNGLDLQVADACGDKEYAAKAKEMKKLQGQFQEAFEAEEWDDALKAADKILAIKPGEFQLGLMKYVILATKKKDTQNAGKYGREFVDKCDDAMVLNEFSWNMLTEEAWADAKDLKLALAGAKKAAELTKNEDPAILDTLARAQVDSGDLKAGIETEKKAVELAKKTKNKQLIKDLEKSLEEYQKKANQGV